MATEINTRLAFFSQLDPIARLFNSQGDPVKDKEFIPSLAKLDAGLEYVLANVMISFAAWRSANNRNRLNIGTLSCSR